jgi:hypothetical protein
MWGWVIALVLFTAVAAALFHAAPWWAVIGLIKAHKGAYATAPGLIGLVAPQWLTVALNLAVALIVGKTLAPALMVASRYCFAQAQDRMLPPVFAETSARKVPLAALLLSAGAGSLFLAQSVFVGWAAGVAVRSLAVLGMWLALAIGTLNFRWHKGYGSTEWGRGVMQQPLVVPAAIISIILAVPLIVSLAVLPNTPLVFQPLFQGAVVLAIGVAILLGARARLRSEGTSFRAIAAELPIECARCRCSKVGVADRATWTRACARVTGITPPAAREPPSGRRRRRRPGRFVRRLVLVAHGERVDALRPHLGFFGRLGDVGGDRDRDFGMQQNPHRMQPGALDRPVEDDLPLVDREAGGCYGLGEVAGRNRAVELSAFAGLANDHDGQALELSADFGGLCAALQIGGF